MNPPSGNPVAQGLEALLHWLEREKSRGRPTIAVLPETERLLGELPLLCLRRADALRQAPAALSSAPAPRESPAREIAPGPGAQAEDPATPAPARDPAPETLPRPTDPPLAADRIPLPPPPDGGRTEAWAREQLNAIFREAKRCERCRSLGTLRDTIVFASGNPLAEVMFVGEAPGAEEEKERKPFVGPAGRKLEQILQAMGLAREDVYISNIVKFRPKKGDGRFQGSSNRKPDATEMEASIRFVRAEIEVVAPRVVVALGLTAAEGLLERGGTISEFRGQAHHFDGVPVVVTYHPSFLLRQESEADPARAGAMKRRVWEDMLRAMEIAGLPISEKQRGYFRQG